MDCILIVSMVFCSEDFRRYLGQAYVLLLQVEHDSSLQLLLVHLLEYSSQVLHLLGGEVSFHNTSVQQLVPGLCL